MYDIQFRNGFVFDSESGTFTKRDLFVRNGVIAAEEENAGAKTVALTDCAASPLAAHTDFLLEAKSDMVSLVDSLIAPMSVINALIVAVAERRKLETTLLFNKLEEIWDLYHVYETDDE